MADIDIKVNIAGRTYPLNIEEKEEENVRAAVLKIKTDLELLEQSYAVKDKQDLLAMLLMQYGNSLMNFQKNTLISPQSVEWIKKTVEVLNKTN